MDWWNTNWRRISLGLAMAILCGVATGKLFDHPAAALEAAKETAPKVAAAEPADEVVARQQQIVERFFTVLERSPRRGTALDKIYGFHIENGTLDALVGRFRDRTAKDPKDGAAWIILGMIESQRGRDAAAVEAFTQAKQLRTDDPVAAYYLGQSLILIGQPDKAIEAFEEAIARKPAQADLLAVFQSLGRVHQQAQQVEKALEVWSRLEKLFPNDPRVQEDIATTLVEEAQFAQALPRYEGLAKKTTDEYRRTVYQMQAAELKIKLNRAAEGIADLETLLTSLNPQSWLFRDVRRQIEEVYLKTNDDDGLAKYYTKWLEKNGKDVDAMARLARVLARQSRVPEAREWLDKALKLAPSRKELRLAFIEQLVDDQRYSDAVAQYVELDKSDPNNPDYLRDWGKMILRDTSRPKADRRKAAEQVWKRLVAARPNDPLIATQAADLFRHSEMPEAALEHYQKAVELAPTAPQYREYLGEFYHILNRKEKALATWRQIADGKQRTATNLARLAEVFVQFGYIKDALPEIAAACELDPKDFALQVKSADFSARAEQFEPALAALDRANKLAQNDEERDLVLAQQIKVYMLDGRLTKLAEDLEKEVAAGKPTHQQLFLLARYQEELRNIQEATKAINAALELEPNHVPTLTAAARVAEQTGELQRATSLHRKLAVTDRRARTEHLERVAQLESQIGRTEEALAAGRELLAAAPGNVETHQFFAELCFRLGQPEEALKTLRRAVRSNPSDQNILMSLAGALSGQFRTDEAIELYWQAFEKAATLDDKLGVIGKLTDLYLQTNHLDRLLERLERTRREADDRREPTICLAQAHQSAGDFTAARQELERLLNENSRDTQLLQQLAKLSETESDLTSAVKYQEQLAKIAPGPETEYKLATMLSRAGRSREASEILVRLSAKEEDKEKQLRNIDGLLGASEFETALQVIEPKLRENPHDWELLYREGVAHGTRNVPEATRRFEAILALDVNDDELSTTGKAQLKSQQRGQNQANPSYAASLRRQQFVRIDYGYEVMRAVGLQNDYDSMYAYSVSGRMQVWTPLRFSQARMAALGWLLRFAQEGGKGDDYIAKYREEADKDDATVRVLWDWAYLCTMRGSSRSDDLMAVSKQLARRDDVAGQYLFLMQLEGRSVPQRAAMNSGVANVKDTTPPLAAEDLELMQRSQVAVRKAMGGRDEDYYTSARLTRIVMNELKRAGKLDEEKQIYEQSVAKAESTMELMTAMQLALGRDDFDTALATFDRAAKRDLQDGSKRSPTAQQVRPGLLQSLCTIMARKDAKPEQVNSILDRFFSYHAAGANARRKDVRSQVPNSRANRQLQPVRVQVGGQRRSIYIPYPQPNKYFDNYEISVLRNAFEFYKQNDLVSDLIKKLGERVANAGSSEKIYAVLALGYAHVWNEDQDAAAKALAQATELEPQELELRLDMAQFYLQAQQLEEAMTQLDAVAPLNQSLLQQRELMALDLAVRLADLDRARLAAQRLFGLRIDPETQLQLSAQMRRLGMNAEAEAVMARAQRQSGGQLSSLAALMTQYQSEGRLELATEVAHQIMRRSRTTPAAQSAMGYSTADSSYRQSALQCLAQAGKLKEIIARVESQLERSPQSTQLFETLAEYYEAAGDSQKSLELQEKIVETRADDADLRYRYAQTLANRGKHAEACEQYKIALKKQPRLLQNRHYEVTRTFQQAKREEEFAKILGEIDIKSIGQPYVVTNLVQNMIQRKEQREVALTLLKKAWGAFPAYRSSLMQSFYDEEIWKLPEVYAFGKQALLPNTEAAKNNRWYGIDNVMSYSSDGVINAMATRVLNGAAAAKELEKLREEIEKTAAEQPNWLAAKPLLAVIDVRLKRPTDVRAAVAALLEPRENDYQVNYARWIIGQEIDARADLRDVAIDLYKAAVRDRNVMNQSEFQFTPGMRLVKLYLDTDQREEARKLLVEALGEKRNDDQYDPSYRIYRRTQNLLSLGQQLQSANFPIDALRAYRELMTDATLNDASLQRIGRDISSTRREVQQQINGIVGKLADSNNDETMMTLLAPREGAAERESAIDLLLSTPVASGGSLGKMDSLAARFISSTKLAEKSAAALQTQLAALAEKRPKDFSVLIAAILVALPREDQAKTPELLEQLRKLVADSPLEEIPAGGRANSRQRTEAALQIPLWLVARECLKKQERRELGQTLSERAIAAAERQLEPNQAAAILHERGLMAIEATDPAAAERDWNRLIELAIVKPRAATTKRSTAAPARPVETEHAVLAPGVLGPGRVVAGTPPQQPPQARRAAKGGKIELPVTLSQFQIGAAVSELAANHDLPEVSLRAIREVVSGGLPVSDLRPVGSDSFGGGRVMRSRSSFGGVPSSASGRADVDQGIYNELATRIWQLSKVWEKKQFKPEPIFEVLSQLVFPATRPGEVLLYEQPLPENWSQSQSVGRILAKWAKLAGKEAALREQIIARRATPTDILAGHVLNAHLGMEAKDFDAVRAALKEIEKLVSTGKLAMLADAAAHAVGPAFDEPKLAADAAPVLDKVLNAWKPQQMRNQAPSLQSPLSKLVRYHVQHDRAEDAKKLVERYLQNRQPEYGRYGGDYGLSIQQADFAWATNELCRGNHLPTTLELLGRFADTPNTQYRNVQIDTAMAHAVHQLRKLPAEERYTTLRDWTLPSGERRGVRVVAGFYAGQPVPSEFLSSHDLPHDATPNFDPRSNLSLLVETAAEVGKLDELATAVKPLAEQKSPGADTLALLTAIARKDGKTASEIVEALTTKFREARTTNQEAVAMTPPYDWNIYLASRTALMSAETAEAGETLFNLLISQARSSNNRGLLNWLRYDLAQRAFRAVPESERPLLESPNLKLWFAGTKPKLANNLLPPTVWAAQDGCLHHVTGCDSEQVFFRYPLEGEFEFNCEMYLSQTQHWQLGYAGLYYAPEPNGNKAVVRPVVGSESVTRGPAKSTWQNDAGWYTANIRVGPSGVRYSFRGYPPFEDAAPSRTSPWLVLLAANDQQATVRNMRLVGKPTVPREVRLVDGDRLDGWAANFFRQSLPPRISAKPPKDKEADPDEERAAEAVAAGKPNFVFPAQAEPPKYSWSAADGVLSGMLDEKAGEQAKGWINYGRPLLSGDKVKYQFRYEPGKVHVHPTVGPLAFILEPAGLRLQWLHQTPGSSSLVQLESDATAVDQASIREPVGQALKENDWNDVEVALNGQTISLTLNGKLICQRKLDDVSETQLGFFHLRGQTAAQVRNIVLSGDWPTTIDTGAAGDLLAHDEPAPSAAVRKQRHLLVTEAPVVENAREILRSLRELPAEVRYARLKAWVLPSDSHSTYRVQGEFAATDQEPAATSKPRTPASGKLYAPVVELLALAKETGKLDDLAAAVTAAAKAQPKDETSIAALELMLAAQRGDDKAAAAGLAKLTELYAKLPDDANVRKRQVFLVAGYGALHRQELQNPLRELATKLAAPPAEGKSLNGDWRLYAANFLGAVEQPEATPLSVASWNSIHRPIARARAFGFAAPRWTATAGEIRYHLGNSHDGLYFAVPLRGDFEFSCEHTTGPDRSMGLLYGGRTTYLSDDNKTLTQIPFFGKTVNTKLDAPAEPKEGWIEHRLTMKDGTLTEFIGGTEVFSDKIAEGADPWLAIVPHDNHPRCAVRKLRITGTPTPPAEIRLTGGDSLAGWQATYFRQSLGDRKPSDKTPRGEPAWARRGDELIGAYFPKAANMSLESLVQYHRPMLEDGAIECEFFYEPEETEVHPALDRLVFLIKPEGLATHTLTDGAFDRSGLAADNSKPVDGAKPISFKAGDWNKMRLIVKGNKAAIEVNGQLAGECDLPATNQRTFGLFHYRDATRARVRNVVYRGDWPKTLPPMQQQELATAK